MFKNMHLIPPPVQDRVAALLDIKTNDDIRQNYFQQVQAIRDFCSQAIEQHDKQFLKRKKSA